MWEYRDRFTFSFTRFIAWHILKRIWRIAHLITRILLTGFILELSFIKSFLPNVRHTWRKPASITLWNVIGLVEVYCWFRIVLSCPLVYDTCKCWMLLMGFVPFSKAISLHYCSGISIEITTKTTEHFPTSFLLLRQMLAFTEIILKSPNPWWKILLMNYKWDSLMGLFVCQHITTEEPLNGFSWNLILRKSTKTCSHVLNRTTANCTWKHLGVR
jgi:hypothetical protein